jgi:tight adherence protein B
MPVTTLFTAGLVFLAVALGTIAIALLLEWGRERLRARTVVKQLREFSEQSFDAETQNLVRQTAASSWVGEAVAQLPRLRDFSHVLREAGSKWTMESFLVICLGIAVAAGLAALLASGSVPAAILAAFLGAIVPYTIVRFRATARTRKLEEQLPDAIDLMGRAMRAGHPLSSGFKMVADELSEPMAGEFRQVFEEQRFGLPLDDSLLSLGGRVRISDMRILITASLIHRTVGGNLAEVLDNIAALVRERFKLRRQLRVVTAQGRMSGYVLGFLPLALGFAIWTLNPGYMAPIFEETVGHYMLFGAVVFQILGYLWIRKILDIEF